MQKSIAKSHFGNYKKYVQKLQKIGANTQNCKKYVQMQKVCANAKSMCKLPMNAHTFYNNIFQKLP